METPLFASRTTIGIARAITFVLVIAMLASYETNAQSGQATAPALHAVIQGRTYQFEKIAEGVYYATGGGLSGNSPIFVNERDVMIVDDGATPAYARGLLEDLKLITDKPVRYVVNTHFHYDHTAGNSVFPPEVEIIGHEYVRTAILTFNVLEREPYKGQLETRGPARVESIKKQIANELDVDRRATLDKELASAQAFLVQLRQVKPTPPNVTYTSKLVLHMGQREVQLLFLGRGHTGGDTVVFLPKERIVCTGDLMESQLSYMGDAFFDEWIAALEELKKLDFTMILPGHGKPFTDKGRIAAFQSYLTDVTNQVATLRKQGVSPEDAALRADLTSHRADYPQIQGPGADLRGVRRIYEWMEQRENSAKDQRPIPK
jgi:cyclase